MADSQQIHKLIESVVAKVFDRRASELRKDLQRGVGDSIGNQVSQLQQDVKTEVAEVFSARVAEIRSGVEAGISEALEARTNDLRKEVDKGIGEVVHRRTADVREQMAQAVTALIDERVSELRGGLEEGVEAAIARRLADLRKELEEVVQDVAGKRISNVRREVERVLSEEAEGRFDDLRKDAAKVVGDIAEKRIGDLRKDIEKMVGKGAEDRLGSLRKDVERIVGEAAEKRFAGIRKETERAVTEAGEQRINELRKEVITRVAEEVGQAFSGKAAAEAPSSTALDSAMVSIQESSSQTDTMRALLDGVANFAGRVALFVVKGTSASGWQARGFEDNAAVKKVSVETGSGIAGQVMQQHGPVTAAAAEFNYGFIRSVGNPSDGNCVILPLMVRDRVPALIYADAGPEGGRLDNAALQLLVRYAGLWLELVTLRKVDGAVDEEAPEKVAVAAAAAVSAPSHRSAPPPSPAQKPKAAPAEPLSAEDEEVHKRARRFAKLLVDEIKLYNQGKVAEGRQHRDLYDRLKEDIEKSRASYEKRYGNTSAAGANYFNQEVIRILADNDASVLGSNFPH